MLFHQLEGWDLSAANVRNGQHLEDVTSPMRGQLCGEDGRLVIVKS